MIHHSLLAVAVLALLPLTGCGSSDAGVPGSGVSLTELRELTEDFSLVDVDGVGTVIVTCGEERSLEIVADDNLLPLLEHRLANGRLSIRPTEPISPNSDLLFRVGLPSLRQLTTRGAVAGEVHAASGEALKLELLGAGTVDVDGAVTTFDASIQGAGAVEAFGLVADEVSVTIAGAGSADVHATRTLGVSIAGAGTVRYQGDPTVDRSVAGIGSVSRHDGP